ncbi:MAG: permease-like cell division protein FtsX [Zoogloeaceae bacterium]|jgi:cell division transport system permease protein|nr:permease-like cell division protein FtsX [Zoogloeaceae bacterium]
MKSWLRQHSAAFLRALKRLRQAPLNTLLSLVVIGIAMTLPAAGYVFLENAKTLGESAAGTQQISLFLDMDARAATVKTVERELEILVPGQWRFVPRAAALEHLQADADLADIVAGLPENPLPDAFILEPAHIAPDELEALRARLARLPGVAHAQLDSAWVERFAAFLALGRLMVSLLATVFAVGLIAVTFNTIRLQVLAQQAEIEVARLIGATTAFVRRPFYYVGLLQGGLGGLAAGVLLTLGLDALQTPIARLAALYGSHFSLAGLSPLQFALLPAIGAALGWIGAQLSVSLALRSHLA